MFRIIIFGILLFNAIAVEAQFNNKKYNKNYFLIGMLNEYMGYQRTFTAGNDFYYQRINIMNRNDLKEALFIDALFSDEYPDIKIVRNGAPMGIKLYSPVLSKKIDSYYNYSPGPTCTVQRDTIYSGNLKTEKFITKKQKRSFLLGAYLCYGKDQNDTKSIIQLLKKENLLEENKAYESGFYAFSMPNAASKAQLCELLLNDLACKEVKYIYRRSIPAGNFVLFKPSRKTLKIITEAELLEQYIETIDTTSIEFTPDGTKYILKEPEKFIPPKQHFDFKKFEGIRVK